MKFTPNIPFVSTTPTVTVDAGMKPGTYLFRLVVEDESGNKSRAAELKVVILRAIVFNPVSPAGISLASDIPDDTDFWPTPER